MSNTNIIELEINNTSLLGLDKKNSKELAVRLNILLASYSILYQNVRGYHWNIKGDKFFELHVKFENLYNHLSLKIDEIAERIVTLGYTANHNFSEYKTISKISESALIKDGIAESQFILNSLKTIINEQREILVLAKKYEDEGSITLMSNYITEQEKMVWMYTSFLETN
jgi:starvation-inducible DNA-binding protein